MGVTVAKAEHEREKPVSLAHLENPIVTEDGKVVSKHPATGRRVNCEGNAVGEDSDVISELTDGDITKCPAGKETEDAINGKGKAVAFLEDVPPKEESEEPKESEEEIRQRKQLEEDNRLGGQLASCLEQGLHKTKPILKMLTDVSLSPFPLLSTFSPEFPILHFVRFSTPNLNLPPAF